MSVINVEEWEVDQVVDWLAGLDSALGHYSQNFASRKIDGGRLLNFMAGDLVALDVDKVGDQVLLADAIQNLRNELESDRVTLQTLASNVAVRAKTYRSELTTSKAKKNFISNESLSSATYLLDAGKPLIRWLTRFPFVGVPDYDDITKQMTKHLFELGVLSQRDSFADNAIEEVQYLCTKIIEICDNIINSKDSLTIQPAAVDVITIRKRHEQELGLQFESSYFGLHMVSGVNLASPAQQSGHLERGDEILQVNYQTVVGWTQSSLVTLLYENPCEVILTVKRRPRHASNSLGHMYLRPSKLPGRNNRSKSTTVSQAILEVEDEKEVVDKNQNSPPCKSTSKDTSTANSHSAAETRFWKLYPKPRNLLRRRATVTGASPTSTRPPVTFTADDEIGDQQKRGSTSRHKLDKCISAPERNKLEKQEQIDETLRLFVGDLNVRGSRVTLPVVGSTLTADPESFKPVRPAKPNLLEDKGREESLDDVFEETVPPPAIPPRAPVLTHPAVNNAATGEKPKASKRSIGEPDVQPRKLEESALPKKVVENNPVVPRNSGQPIPPVPLPRKLEEAPVTPPPRRIEEAPPPPPVVRPRKLDETSASPLMHKIVDEPSVLRNNTEEPPPVVPSPRKPANDPSVALSSPPRVVNEMAAKVSAKVDVNPIVMQTRTNGISSTTSSLLNNKELPLSSRRQEDSSAPTSPTKIDGRRRSIPSKPQSLTNLSTVGTDVSGGTMYTGFLHQRQPHWKFGGPRWSRCRATVDSQVFRLLKPELEIPISSASVTLASEVHSRPFAFKIEDKKDKSSVHYFAAESQPELNIWLEHLGVGEEARKGRGSAVLNRSMSVQPDGNRNLSSPLSEKQRRLSLPQSHLQNQFRKKFNKLQQQSSTSSSTGSIYMEDKLRFWNSTPSPTHKSNISSITITSCKRNQQLPLQDSPTKKQMEGPLRTRITDLSERDGGERLSRPLLIKRTSLDSPTKKCRMGVSMLLRRKGSDSMNNNDACCTCGRSYSSSDKSTQTEELVLIFSGGGAEGESRI